MKSLLDKIYEGFYSNIGMTFDKTLITPSINVLKRKDFDDRWKKVYLSKNTRDVVDWKAIEEDPKSYEVINGTPIHRYDISKGALDYGIDSLAGAILKTGIKPAKGQNYSKEVPRDMEPLFDKLHLKEYKVYTDNAIQKILKTLCEDSSLVSIIKDMCNEQDKNHNNVRFAFVWAAVKYYEIADENMMFSDLATDKEGVVGSYVIDAFDHMRNVNLPVSASGLDAVRNEESQAYDKVLADIDTLKVDIQLLKDNHYPFNAMVEKTIRDIQSRCSVIARLSAKFKR